MKRSTTEWVQKAEDDYRGARALAKEKPPLHDLICFHCQQCAEKYLKGLLEETQRPIPKTHDLTHLLEVLLPGEPALRSLRRGLNALTRYAVDIRYPGHRTTRRQSTAA